MQLLTLTILLFPNLPPHQVYIFIYNISLAFNDAFNSICLNRLKILSPIYNKLYYSHC
ncbi:hypothetical protein DSUL_50093 [Desulfovibrionales bacterium]